MPRASDERPVENVPERSTTQNTEPRVSEDFAAATGTTVELDPVSERPAHDRIASRAYEHYLNRGQESGSDLDDWLRAERELQGDYIPDGADQTNPDD